MTIEQTYFRKGFGLKDQVRPVIDSEYQSALVEDIRARGYTHTFGDVTVRLAEEFGFCYGVDRAVDYAYETRTKFPDKKVYLVGEIIHNPHVNRRMNEMDIEFIYPDEKGKFDFSSVKEDDVVLLPASVLPEVVCGRPALRRGAGWMAGAIRPRQAPGRRRRRP